MNTKRVVFKTEANARTHARKAKLDLDTLIFETDDEGKWFYYPSVSDAQDDAPAQEVAAPASDDAPVPDVGATDEPPMMSEADASAAATHLVTQAEETLPVELTADSIVTIEVADSPDSYGPDRWDAAQDMGRMIAESEGLTIVLLDANRVERARFEGTPKVAVEPEAPAAPDAPPAPAPAPDAAPASTDAAPAKEVTLDGITHPASSTFVNPESPELPALPDGTGYIIRLRSKFDGRRAFMWASTYARTLKLETEVVHPETGEVVAVGRAMSKRAQRQVGMGSGAKASTARASTGDATPATPATPKAPRENADELAAKGIMPKAPSYDSPSRQKYIPILKELQDVIDADDVEKVRAFTKYAAKLAGGFRALEQYRQRVIAAMDATNARNAAEAKDAA